MRLSLPTKLRIGVPRAILLAAALPVALVAARQARAQVNPDATADAALADRIEGLAARTFPADVPTGADRPLVFAQQAALFQAAAKLDPNTVRYPRKVAEALSYGGAPLKEQYDALSSVLRLLPGDEFTWVKLLDLHIDELQAAPAQLDYLKKIEANPAVPRAVLAHAGARHAQILFDQGKEQAARTLLQSVLTNNPLDLDALHLQYRLMPASATTYEREQALLNILRANPMQPAYARQAALIAADAGLTQDSITFFSLAVNTSVALHKPDVQGALEWAAELYMAGQNIDAYRFVQSLLQNDPNSAEAWYLDLLVVRSSNLAQAQQDKDLQRARIVFANRLAEVVNAAQDATNAGPANRPTRATTRPFDAEGAFPLPDVGPTVALVKQANEEAVPPRLRRELIEAVADLARLEIYFAHKPEEAAPLIRALTELLPANDPLVTQLQGLSSLVAGDAKNAMATLAGVARQDPVAAMGLIQAQLRDDPKATEKPDLEARKLIQDHASGLIGALLLEGLSNPRVKLVPKNGSEQLQHLLQAFPRELLNLAGNANRLYSVHVEPVDAGRAWGEPLLAKITLFNFSPFDLTVGEDGAIRPALFFQLVPRIAAQPVGYAAYDTLAGPVVLHPRAPLTQVVRVDQAGLLPVLDATIGIAFQIDGQAGVNADTGVGGFPVRFTKPFDRAAVNADAKNEAVNRLNAAGLNGATPAQRLNAVGILQAFILNNRALRNLPPSAVQELGDLTNTLRRARTDASAPVAAWARQADFTLTDGPSRPPVLIDMSGSADWRQKLIAMVLARWVRDPALQHKVIDGLQNDPEPCVAAYAKASAELLKLNLFSQPVAAAATAPSTRPAPAAGGDVP